MDEKEANDDVYRMLSESGYSDKAIEYFKAKENVGVIEDADQVTESCRALRGYYEDIFLCIRGQDQ